MLRQGQKMGQGAEVEAKQRRRREGGTGCGKFNKILCFSKALIRSNCRCLMSLFAVSRNTPKTGQWSLQRKQRQKRKTKRSRRKRRHLVYIIYNPSMARDIDCQLPHGNSARQSTHISWHAPLSLGLKEGQKADQMLTRGRGRIERWRVVEGKLKREKQSKLLRK